MCLPNLSDLNSSRSINLENHILYARNTAATTSSMFIRKSDLRITQLFRGRLVRIESLLDQFTCYK